ncbi:MAG: hypothetical protein ABI859_17405, partial [Pseudomonadota bacterium]
MKRKSIMNGSVCLAVVMLGCAGVAQAQDATVDAAGGEALYRQHCASCHDAGVPRAATRATLALLSPEQIRSA